MSRFRPREFITARSRWPAHGVVGGIDHFAQEFDQSLSDDIVAGELEIRTRGSLTGLKKI